MNILFVVSEVEGLVKTGGLADVGRALPVELAAMGHDVRIVVPFYKAIADKHPAQQVTDTQSLHAHERHYPFTIKQMDLDGLCVYGIDFPLFFERDGIYSDSYEAYPDNPERFAFFSMAALTAAYVLNFKPDIVHCNDWHTALTPYFLKTEPTGFYEGTRSILTIHNGAFQCQHNFGEIPFLHPYSDIAQKMDHNGAINYLKIGIEYADKINAVSPQYGRELLTPLGSHHMYQDFMQRMHDVTGILNGCDYSQWDPATDKEIPVNYDVNSLHLKAECKSALQQEVGLTVDPKIPVIGLVCRLTEQKGFGFLVPALWHLMQHNVQVVIIGTGDPSICEELHHCADHVPDKFIFINDFSNRLAHMVEAGSDFFLMPSLFEPCGLNQMYSLAYGTIPIVRAVGGLKDTVIDLHENPYQSTGFVFEQPDASVVLHCIQRALLFYYEYPQGFMEMQVRAMNTRFTWHDAAKNYVGLYEDALRKNHHH